MEKLNERKAAVLSFTVLSLVFLLLCARCFFGFDWSDETYYLALPYRFALGDQLFLHSWDIHQLSAVLLVPFVRLYLLVAGSAKGILLFFRLFYTLLQFTIAAAAFSIFKKRFSIFSSLLASLFYLLFTPANIQNFSYNTLSLSFLFLSILMLFSQKKKIALFLSGVFFALAVQCYPFLIFFLPVILAIFIVSICRTTERKAVLFSTLFFVGGCLLVLVLFLLTVLTQVSFSDVVQSLPYLFTDPEHPPRGLIQPFISYVQSFWSNYRIASIGIGICTILLLLIKAKHRIIPTRWKKTLFLAAVAYILAEFVRTAVTQHTGIMQAHLFLVPFALTGPIFLLLSKNFSRVKGPFLLWGAGVLFSLAVSFGTNNTYTFYSYPFILCAIAGVLLISGCIEQLFPSSIPLRVSCSAFLCCFALILCSLRVTEVYRDAPIPTLTSQLAEGPGAYIFTTDQEKEKYEKEMRAFSYLPKKGTVLFSKLLPFGYLSTTALPASPSLWRTPLTSERLIQYYRLHPDKLPDCVFVAEEGYGVTNENNPLGAFFEEYLRDFTVTELDGAAIYRRQP